MCLVFPEWKLILLEMVIRPWIGLLYNFGIQVPNVGFNDLSPTTGDHQAQISRLFPNSNSYWVANFGAPVRLIVRVNMTPTLNKRFVSWSKKICRGRCLKRGQFLRWKNQHWERNLSLQGAVRTTCGSSAIRIPNVVTLKAASKPQSRNLPRRV